MQTSGQRDLKLDRGISRLEDEALLAGQGAFTDDIAPSDAAVGIVLRSPHPAAQITKVDSSEAAAMPGVLGIVTGVDLAQDKVGSLDYLSTVEAPEGGFPKVAALPILALHEVRYVGQPVAFVVAETREEALDAAERIEIEFEPRDHVVDVKAAVAEAAPRVDTEAAGNIAAQYRLGDPAACDRAIEGAWRSVSMSIRNNRVLANAMEPRAAFADYRPKEDRWTLVCGNQAPHHLRQLLAECVFGVEEERIRVKVGRLGGGFGAKLTPYPEDALVMYAARKLGRPVRWRAERSEAFLADYHSRDHTAEITLAFNEDLRITALRIHDRANLGAYPTRFGIPIATTTGNRIVNGVYDIPVVDLTVQTVLTNSVPTGPYRGAGRPEVIHRLEMALDKAARELGVDSVELRRQNLIAPEKMPYPARSGLTYDSGNFGLLLEKALSASDWRGFPARKAESARRGMLRGRGVACHIDSTSGLSPKESVRVEVGSEGKVTFYSGTQEMGQGLHSTYLALAAKTLGISAGAVEVVQGDTDAVASGTGSYGSRSLYIGGAALVAAGELLISDAIRLAVPLLEAAESDLSYSEGAVQVVGTDRRVTLAEIAAAQPSRKIEVEGDAEAPFCFPNGCYVCEVEIDRDTGSIAIARFLAVDDVGNAINPTMIEGQVHGGLAQGIGQALFEQVRYDTGSGQLTSGSFMDYAMPRAGDLILYETQFEETQPAATNPLGAKGAGESGAVGAPPAVCSAVLDALHEFGVDSLEMPLTPEKVWRAMAASGTR